MLVPGVPRHHRSVSLSDTLITNQSSGTEVLARGLIGTRAQMQLITRIITIASSPPLGAPLLNFTHYDLLQLAPKTVESQIGPLYIYPSSYPDSFTLDTFSHPYLSRILILEGSNVSHEFSSHSLSHLFHSLSRCPASNRFILEFLTLNQHFWSVTPSRPHFHSFSHFLLMSRIRYIIFIIPEFNLDHP